VAWAFMTTSIFVSYFVKPSLRRKLLPRWRVFVGQKPYEASATTTLSGNGDRQQLWLGSRCIFLGGQRPARRQRTNIQAA
jgi:lipocalin